jgi:IS5 family transposase
VLEALSANGLEIEGRLVTVLKEEACLRHYVPLVEKVINQTEARVFAGQTHYQDKILSLFEEHTALIRKGKPDKPTEFGRLVRLDEVENGILSGYAIAQGNESDQKQWIPALSQHRERFGQVPRLGTADRGFWNAQNEKEALAMGVKQVVLPALGRLSAKRAEHQKQAWFRRGQGWRAGIEARISTLKHPFGMKRARYKGEAGFERYVGWCVIAQNLVAIVRAGGKKATQCRSG